jgi:S1-C subfamily serine protease
MLGDVLLALDGTPVADTDDVQAVLSRSNVGQTINATILRGGEQREIILTLGHRTIPKGK